MTRVVLFFAVLLLPALVAASQIDFDQKLYDSVEAGDITAMQNALTNGGDPNSRTDPGGRTMLHLAISMKRRDMAALLINNGADITTLSNTGHDALIYAAIAKMSDIVAALLAVGADVNTQVAPWAKTAAGNTALHIATMHGDVRTVRILVRAGANVHILNEVRLSPIDIALKAENSVALLTELGESPTKYLSEETIRTQAIMRDEL